MSIFEKLPKQEPQKPTVYKYIDTKIVEELLAEWEEFREFCNKADISVWNTNGIGILFTIYKQNKANKP